MSELENIYHYNEGENYINVWEKDDGVFIGIWNKDSKSLIQLDHKQKELLRKALDW